MSISELIAECEKIDKEATKGPWYHVDALTPEEAGIQGGTLPQVVIDSDDEEFPPVDLLQDVCKDRDYEFIARSRTLLPLLVAVIKNQQRQIEELKDGLGDMLDGESQSYRRETFESVNKSLAELEAELEDVKP